MYRFDIRPIPNHRGYLITPDGRLRSITCEVTRRLNGDVLVGRRSPVAVYAGLSSAKGEKCREKPRGRKHWGLGKFTMRICFPRCRKLEEL